MKKNLLIAVSVAGLFLLIALSCSREDGISAASPAFKLMETERLSIPAAIELPANLPNGNSRVATFYAEGLQKYKAQVKAGSDPVMYEWLFVAPEADLYDASNAKVGTHGAGPFWQLSATDSIFGQAFTPAKTATPDANSIPWLQLVPKNGKMPTGIFSNVAYIQRIATTGGKAPEAAPKSLSDKADVFYTAVYRFSKKNP